MNCKFCNSINCSIKKKVKSAYNNQFYDLYVCRSCHSYFFDHEQHSTSLKEFYNQIPGTEGNEPLKIEPSRKWIRQVAVIKKLFKKTPGSVLDLGCRTGDFLMHFEKSTLLEGVELSDHSANIAAQRGLKIYNDFLENIDFKNKYDVISAYAILEHVQKPLAFIDKLNLIINPSGLLVILIPTHQCLKRKLLDVFKFHWHMYSPPEHLNFYSRQFLDKYLQVKGFKLKKRYYTTGGMISISRDFHLINKLVSKFMEIIDNSPLNRFPIFDHMYSYYIFR